MAKLTSSQLMTPIKSTKPVPNSGQGVWANGIQIGSAPKEVNYGSGVLGIDTKKTSNGTIPTGTIPTSSNGNNGNNGNNNVSTGPSMDSLINDMFGSGINLYNDIEGQIKSSYPTEKENLEASVNNDINKVNTEGDTLLSDVNDNQTAFNKTIQSALQDAVRAYNAMQQQARTRFGFGSSAGQAVGELAQQEYFKQQGEQNDRGTQGALAFEKERGRIKTYVKQKVDDLDQYKREAIFTLEENFKNRLNQIAMAKGELEANKNKMRLEALQGTISQMRSVEQDDKNFRRDLGLAAVTKMQEIAGRAFTPKEISAVLGEFGVNLANPTYSTRISGGTPAYSTTPLKTTNNEDELNTLNPLG